MKRISRLVTTAECVGLVAWFALSKNCMAQTPADLSDRVGSAKPLAELPPHIPSTDGQMTFFADFQDVRGDQVRLYLVNRTNQRIGFSHQGGDVYVKLEALTELGDWERAQSHTFSFCGNSYFGVMVLGPNEFFRFMGYFPADGEPRIVRFRVFEDEAFLLADQTLEELRMFDFIPGPKKKVPLHLVSNAGAGRIRSADVLAARYDKLALRFGSFDALQEIALGLVNPMDQSQDPAEWAFRRMSPSEAMSALSRFPDDATFAVYDALLQDADVNARLGAVRGIGIIGPKCPAAEARFQEILRCEDARDRVVAVYTLAERPIDLEVIEFLRCLHEDPEVKVRIAALGVLARVCLKFPEAEAAVRNFEFDSHPRVQSMLKALYNPQRGWCTTGFPIPR